MCDNKNPKLFISYSWTNDEHISWVLKLATELREAGIDVILDKWDLKEGNDANAFMERMVADSTVHKVVLICDKIYVEKTDARAGGVGTEAQIISSEVYSKTDQEKFVAIVSNRDETGAPYLPIYYKSRIYIDLSSDEVYSKNFEQLLRWAYDKPLYIKPELGGRPAFIDENSIISLGTTSTHRRLIEAIKNGKSFTNGVLEEYLTIFSENLEKYRLEPSKGREDFDQDCIDSIDNFIIHRNEIIEVFIVLSKYCYDDSFSVILHSFFERLIPYTIKPTEITSWHRWDYDNLKFIINELFIYCLSCFIKHRRYQIASYLIHEDYFVKDDGYSNSSMNNFGAFNGRVIFLEHRNTRLKKRRLSLHADLLKERCTGVGVNFNDFMQADFILYLADALNTFKGLKYNAWFPNSLLYTTDYCRPFELFVRGQSRIFFNEFKCLLNIENVEEIKEMLASFTEKGIQPPKWQYESLSPNKLLAIDKLGTS